MPVLLNIGVPLPTPPAAANQQQNRDHQNKIWREESETLIAGDECEGDEDQRLHEGRS